MCNLKIALLACSVSDIFCTRTTPEKLTDFLNVNLFLDKCFLFILGLL